MLFSFRTPSHPLRSQEINEINEVILIYFYIYLNQENHLIYVLYRGENIFTILFVLIATNNVKTNYYMLVVRIIFKKASAYLYLIENKKKKNI